VHMYLKFVFVEILKGNGSEKHLIVMCTSGTPWYHITVFMESPSLVIVDFPSERQITIFKHLQLNFTKQTDWLWTGKQTIFVTHG
jgi:hypothetical protein